MTAGFMMSAGSSAVRLLVPKQQIGCVLGKQGSTITSIRNTTGATVKVQDHSLPACAKSGTEELITILGEEPAVTAAAKQVAAQLRTYQVPGGAKVAGPPGATPTAGPSASP